MERGTSVKGQERNSDSLLPFQLKEEQFIQAKNEVSRQVTESDEFTCFMMQPYFAESQRTNRSVISLQNFDQAEFLFFKMLVLSELMNMPQHLSNSLMNKEPMEMYRRAKNDAIGRIFFKF